LRVDIIIKDGRRSRYIGFNVSTSDNHFFNKKDIIDIVRKQSLVLFDRNFKEMDLFIVRFNGMKGIIRCRHTEKENTIKLMKSIKIIGTRKVKIDTIATSGTIKALIKKHMRDFE
jgi:RNase P/RNase MRP subunit POP5